MAMGYNEPGEFCCDSDHGMAGVAATEKQSSAMDHLDSWSDAWLGCRRVSTQSSSWPLLKLLSNHSRRSTLIRG